MVTCGREMYSKYNMRKREEVFGCPSVTNERERSSVWVTQVLPVIERESFVPVPSVNNGREISYTSAICERVLSVRVGRNGIVINHIPMRYTFFVLAFELKLF